MLFKTHCCHILLLLKVRAVRSHMALSRLSLVSTPECWHFTAKSSLLGSDVYAEFDSGSNDYLFINNLWLRDGGKRSVYWMYPLLLFSIVSIIKKFWSFSKPFFRGCANLNVSGQFYVDETRPMCFRSSINLNSKSNSIRASTFWKKDKTQKMLKVAFAETKNWLNTFRSAYAFAVRQHTGMVSKSKSARKHVYWRLRGSTEIFSLFEIGLYCI